MDGSGKWTDPERPVQAVVPDAVSAVELWHDDAEPSHDSDLGLVDQVMPTTLPSPRQAAWAGADSVSSPPAVSPASATLDDDQQGQSDTAAGASKPELATPVACATTATATPASGRSSPASQDAPPPSRPSTEAPRRSNDTSAPPSRRVSRSGDRTSSGFRKSFSALNKSFSAVGRTVSHAVMGDDDTVQDKWDTFDDDFGEDDVCKNTRRNSRSHRQEELARVSRASGESTRKPGSSFSMALRSASSKVHPMVSRATSTASEAAGAGAGALAEVLSEKGSARVLVWGYFQALMFSVLVAAVCIPLVTVLSLVPWSEDLGPRPQDINLDPHNTTRSIPRHGIIRPNHKAFQWMLLVQIVLPLVIYAVALYVCIRRTFRLPWLLIGIVVFTISWGAIVCGLFYMYDVAFWFYYLDLFIIVAAFVPCMAVVGWLIETDEAATIRHRLRDVFFTAVLETIVAAATLVYCLFIMPLFFMMRSAWLQVLWLCVLHPLYFEITTGYVVRKALYRNRDLGRNHIVYFLTIVHSMVHTVALSTTLQASIEPVKILALTVFLYNVSKLIWRSTVVQRDLLIEKLLNGWSFKYSDEESADLTRMVSVGILTEIVLENASIFITPYMMFRMYKEPVFMAVVPNTFFFNGGTYPVRTLVMMIFVLMAFTITFDLIFYFLNYHAWQCLPLINTWRRIKKSQGWYLLFLIYGFACMGVIFLFLTMMILPRAAFCKSDDYCDCQTPAYQNICDGRYNSVMGDYLLDPYDG